MVSSHVDHNNDRITQLPEFINACYPLDPASVYLTLFSDVDSASLYVPCDAIAKAQNLAYLNKRSLSDAGLLPLRIKGGRYKDMGLLAR